MLSKTTVSNTSQIQASVTLSPRVKINITRFGYATMVTNLIENFAIHRQLIRKSKRHTSVMFSLKKESSFGECQENSQNNFESSPVNRITIAVYE
jgi:hypothetical protein